MDITEVKVKLVNIKAERLKAFCTITVDGEFVVRDIKVIEGGSGLFVAMPSRKLADKCPKCNTKNHLRARFCNECGSKLSDSRIPKDTMGQIKLHADIAHPINSQCRQRIQRAVLDAYHNEMEHSKLPDYAPPRLNDVDTEHSHREPSTESVHEDLTGLDAGGPGPS